MKQTFDRLVVHTPHGTSTWPLPFTFSTFDYPRLCELLDDQNDAEFETAKVNGRTGFVVHTDRGDLSAPLIVDALGWRRVLAGDGYQPPDAPLSRGLEVHPHGSGDDLELWIDRSYVPAGYGWSFPAADELRIGVGSFDPRYHVKEPTVRLAEDLGEDAVRYQGNWIPHKIRPAAEDGIFFAGDSAGHCLPLTAEGIRTAWYFGIACGRELPAGARWACHARAGARALRRVQPPPRGGNSTGCSAHSGPSPASRPGSLRGVVARDGPSRRCRSWAFGHYLRIAPPPSDGRGAGADRSSRSRSPRGERPQRPRTPARACRGASSRRAAARSRCRGRSPPGRTRLARSRRASGGARPARSRAGA